MVHWRIEDMSDMQKRMIPADAWKKNKVPPGKFPIGKPSKMRNVRTRVDGILFDSAREAEYYEELKLRRASLDVHFFLRQVPIHLPGKTVYRVDFLVFDNAGAHFVDVKGLETPMFRLKRRQVEALYPITIEIVR